MYKHRSSKVTLYSATLAGFVIVLVLLDLLYKSNLEVGLDRDLQTAKPAELLQFSVLCGAAAFASVEVIKRLTPVRAAVQRRLATEWLGRGGSEDPRQDLRVLQAAVGREAFALPAGNLTGTLADEADRQMVISPSGRLLGVLSERKYQQDSVPSALGDAAYEQVLAAQVERSVASLHVYIDHHWRVAVQATAFFLSAAYGVLFSSSAEVEASLLLSSLVLGGPIAWELRDLTKQLERGRDG